MQKHRFNEQPQEGRRRACRGWPRQCRRRRQLAGGGASPWAIENRFEISLSSLFSPPLLPYLSSIYLLPPQRSALLAIIIIVSCDSKK